MPKPLKRAAQAPEDTGVPDPLVLLSIQFGGGVFAFIAILTLPSISKSELPGLMWTLEGFGLLNVVVSGWLLAAGKQKWTRYDKIIAAIEPIGLVRATLLLDALLLGTLVTMTGGAQESMFAPQFAALLPIAMLIPDTPQWKLVHAGVFMLMFVFGLFLFPQFRFEYIPRDPKPFLHTLWFVSFFFVFTCFPTAYSIFTEKSQASARTSARRHIKKRIQSIPSIEARNAAAIVLDDGSMFRVERTLPSSAVKEVLSGAPPEVRELFEKYHSIKAGPFQFERDEIGPWERDGSYLRIGTGTDAAEVVVRQIDGRVFVAGDDGGASPNMEDEHPSLWHYLLFVECMNLPEASVWRGSRDMAH